MQITLLNIELASVYVVVALTEMVVFIHVPQSELQTCIDIISILSSFLMLSRRIKHVLNHKLVILKIGPIFTSIDGP